MSVKEKKQGDGGALSGTDAPQSSNTVDDVGKDNDGLNSSPTMVTPGNFAVNKEDNLHNENDGLASSKSTANANKCTFYANLFTSGLSRKAMNFRTLFTAGNGVDVVVPVESIRAISERFASTAYGFFLGKRVAYPVVANYVWNTWAKYELWNPDVNLLKEDVGNVLVWVKLYGVPAFSEDGLSAIATKIGTSLMLHSYTCDMCIHSWGMSSYASALIEVRANVKLKDNIVVAIVTPHLRRKHEVKGKQERDKIRTKPEKKRSVEKPGSVKANHSQESRKMK
nr:hypothetical protein [Tanacetum cinerariifolium]